MTLQRQQDTECCAAKYTIAKQPDMAPLSTLGDIQRKRSQAFPEKLSENALRATLLEGLHRRNAVLDAIFYDVGTITEDENEILAKQLAREGAIVVVPPTGEGQLALYQDVASFVSADQSVAALAVAGVGSSALGAAAFARNVADALNAKVAAVVSGHGLADLLTEAMAATSCSGASTACVTC